MLLGFGLAGAAGNFTAGVTVRGHLWATLMGAGLLIACSALLLAAVTGARPLTVALVAVWGLGFGAVPVAGAAISAPSAGSADLARARGREAPAPPPGTTDGAGKNAQ